MKPAHQFTDIDELATIAHRIITDGPRAALNACLSNTQAADFLDAAQRHQDGDTADLEYLLAELTAAENPEGYGSVEPEWRGSWAAESHFPGRFGL